MPKTITSPTLLWQQGGDKGITAAKREYEFLRKGKNNNKIMLFHYIIIIKS